MPKVCKSLKTSGYPHRIHAAPRRLWRNSNDVRSKRILFKRKKEKLLLNFKTMPRPKKIKEVTYTEIKNQKPNIEIDDEELPETKSL